MGRCAPSGPRRWSAGDTAGTETRTRWHPTPTPRRSWPSGRRSTTGGGRESHASCGPAVSVGHGGHRGVREVPHQIFERGGSVARAEPIAAPDPARRGRVDRVHRPAARPEHRPGPGLLDFDLSTFASSGVEAYEILLLEAMHGDQTLFIRQETLERAWEVLAPFEERRRPSYGPGTWGGRRRCADHPSSVGDAVGGTGPCRRQVYARDVLLTRDVQTYEFGGARFDLDRDRTSWRGSSASSSSERSLACRWGPGWPRPDSDAAQFLARQANDEMAHVKLFLRVLASLEANAGRPIGPCGSWPPTSPAERTWSTAPWRWPGEGFVLMAIYALIDTLPESETLRLLIGLSRQEEGHVSFGEEQTSRALRRDPSTGRHLLGLALVSFGALGRLGGWVRRKYSGHPVLSQMPGFLAPPARWRFQDATDGGAGSAAGRHAPPGRRSWPRAPWLAADSRGPRSQRSRCRFRRPISTIPRSGSPDARRGSGTLQGEG